MRDKLWLILALIVIPLGLVGCSKGENPKISEEEMKPLYSVTEVHVYFLGGQPSITYNGQCPATITFIGDIVVDGPCTVTYRWVRSDGAQGPVETGVFDAAGALQVSNTWTLGGSGWSITEWERIDILTPEPMQSNEATFTLNCSP